MKISLIVILIILGIIPLFSQLHWQNTYTSGLLTDSQRIVRTRAEQGSVELFTRSTSGIDSHNLLNISDGYNSYQTQIAEPISPYLGFRSISEFNEIIPVFTDTGSTPVFNDYTPLLTDPIGDQAYTFTYLDLRSASATFDNNKLYFALKNNGGGFPTSSGFTYFSYMATLVNPLADSTANTIVYGLMYTVNITGIISPGLYKISGTGLSDMTLIGQISASVDNANNAILLSCNIADLLADSDFSSWYDVSNPKLGFMALTNKITLTSGIQVADLTSSCHIIPKAISINQSPAMLPQLSNLQIIDSNENQIYVTADYYSPDAFLPVTAEVQFSNGYVAYLNSLTTPDFESTVMYGCQIDYNQISGWDYATFRFSCDGIGFTESVFDNTSLVPEENAVSIVSDLEFDIFPNPSRGTFSIANQSLKGITKVEIFNAKGQSIVNKNSLATDFNSIDLGSVASGVYLVKVIAGNQIKSKKLIIVK
jgi:hypothetical protein